MAGTWRRGIPRQRPWAFPARYEVHESMESAIGREKVLKEWKRRWKIGLIEAGNPYWRDLYPDIL
ncbi:hypothetical protein WQ53_14445 [Pseudoxanthomonas suwonensis]|uniref:GIY-YIG domain-containing protein n=1 Tax=Pseudoxanthomonas suwonensis TaxID=314722 RepID=A0A0E3Z4E5_9GAMM|nr:hypothetical protein WQ53_14445 [Pseudoxanthomonas suwonensis]